ncbi:MAG: RNA polymerase sigma-54 factor [Flavobacteriales bacterium]|nr:MAG: RNA polymerase sigma-54 factor [Flavobacteriales bacterium]
MLKQTLQQKLLQKLSPQQIQLMKLLQLPTIALEQRIKEELEGNPALDEGKEEDEQADEFEENEFDENDLSDSDDEFDFSDYVDDDEIPDYKLYTSNKGADAEDKDIPFSVGKTFHELLESQLGLRVLTEHEQIIAETLIGNLDDAGYLRRELSSIVDDLAFTQYIDTTEEEVLSILNIIQELDPPGIGARGLQECLLLQLDRKISDENIATAKLLLKESFDEFTKKHYEKIVNKLGITEEELRDAMDEVLKLNPKPGNSLNENIKVIEHIIPDFIISNVDGELELTLNSRNAPELRMNRKYSEMIETYSKSKEKPNREQKEALLFVKQKLDSAKWFIDAIRQRQHTLLLTMDAIMHHQKEYFLTGDETKLKPMILQNIAEKVNLDISTISRVSNSKYVQTPYGTFLLKTFFSESLSTNTGEEVSTREVKKILQDLLEAEDKKKPITDERLGEALREKGYNIARRTVAKYREQLGISVARLRKEL